MVDAGITGRADVHPRNKVPSRAHPAGSGSRKVLILLFIFCLALPISFTLGPIRLSPSRTMILLFIVPSLMALLSGRLGRIRATDYLMFLFGAWGAISLFVTTNFDAAIEPSGIFFIESFGSYLLARNFVRGIDDFIFMMRFTFLLVLALLPFAIFESLTNRAILLEVLRPFFQVYVKGEQTPRLGLHRAQVVFDHPIMYGVFVSSLLGVIYYSYGRSKQRFPRSVVAPSLVVFASIFSVSTGAIATVAMQSLLIAWDHLTKSIKNRWAILGGLAILGYVVIDVLSNRSPFHVFVSYLTLSTGSAYTRILIFQFGFAEVLRHPIFGIGLAEWTRPRWLGGSVDNMWLVIAMRHGLPAFFFLAAAIASMMVSIGRKQLASLKLQNCRTGLLVSLGGMIFAAATVHYWNAIYVWFLFIVGCGMWLLQVEDENPEASTGSAKERTLNETKVTDAAQEPNNPWARRGTRTRR